MRRLTPKLRAERVAEQRRELLQRFFGLVQKGYSKASAAAEIGVSCPTLWRWEKRLQENGVEALKPQTWRCGRQNPIRTLRISEAVIQAVRLLNLRMSNRSAWAFFLTQPECPKRLAQFLKSRPDIPASLLRATRLRRIFVRCTFGDGVAVFQLPPELAQGASRVTSAGVVQLPSKNQSARKCRGIIALLETKSPNEHNRHLSPIPGPA